ncbi:pentapeptide repeat-containing protein [Catellatospora methionotrophica]|uniref:pentapeptide repeat-containing protein n=1 Tax=Catellatospora methionotrophica TaxID=121620 RepID=UPI00340D807E
MSSPASAQPWRERLHADCSRCFALCCVAPAFARSSDFAIDKPAGTACPNLRADFACGIHTGLRERGFAGCTVFDCFGAGQQVAQVTFGGRDWRAAPDSAPDMFASFAVMRHLHELLYYLHEAVSLRPGGTLDADLARVLAGTEQLTGGTPAELAALDVAALRREAADLLRQASAAARGRGGRPGPDRSGTDLLGVDLRAVDLRRASLRGTYLIGADLRGADLRGADLLGADLRGADIRGADLTGCLYLIQSQLDAARGDGGTLLPPVLTRPAHWPASHTATGDATSRPRPARPRRSRGKS